MQRAAANRVEIQFFGSSGSKGKITPIIELIVEFVIAISCLIIAWQLYRKQKIILVHSCHRCWVKPEDVKAYTALYGKAMAALGGGVFLMALVNFVPVRPGAGWRSRWVSRRSFVWR